MQFFEQLGQRIEAIDSVVSVGLDPDPERLPEAVTDHERPRWEFNRRIIDATNEYAAVYKPNAAFYEDPSGWRALEQTIEYAHGQDVPVILDAKRGDIGNTAEQYASALDSADSITVNPYLGGDSLEPFLERTDAGVFVLCCTSNPGHAALQTLEVTQEAPDDSLKLYEHVADLAAEWNDHGSVGLVVGATTPAQLRGVRERVPELPFLVPGVGAQGGDAEAAMQYGLADGVGVINSSRGIIFAGEDEQARADAGGYFAAAGAAARALRQRLNQHR